MYTAQKREKPFTIFLSFLFLLLFLGMGAGGLYYSFGKVVRNLGFVAHGVQTTGSITGYEESWSKDEDGSGYTKMYAPVITYYDRSRNAYRLDADYRSNSRDRSRQVTVYFDKENPSKAVRGGFWHLWFWPFAVGCLSMIPMAIGVFIFNSYIRTLFKKK